jgi:hypothetical protein
MARGLTSSILNKDKRQIMAKSRFTVRIFLPLILSVFLPGMVWLILAEALTNSSFSLLLVFTVVIIILIFIWTWLVFGELRTKAISVIINENSVSIKGFIGLGSTRKFDLYAFDGFTTSILTSNSGSYEYLYLMKDKKKIVKISEFYHKNYLEMKQCVSIKMRYMGEIPFSLSEEFKEVFH